MRRRNATFSSAVRCTACDAEIVACTLDSCWRCAGVAIELSIQPTTTLTATAHNDSDDLRRCWQPALPTPVIVMTTIEANTGKGHHRRQHHHHHQ